MIQLISVGEYALRAATLNQLVKRITSESSYGTPLAFLR
jgi:hypothetical protein